MVIEEIPSVVKILSAVSAASLSSRPPPQNDGYAEAQNVYLVLNSGAG